MKRFFGCENVLIPFFVCMVLILIIGMDMSALADTVIPESEFQDDNLYEYVMSNFDYNANGQLEQSEAEAVEKIELYIGELLGTMSTIDELGSIKGLEHFTNLTVLIINNGDDTQITDISVISKLTKLKELRIRSEHNIVDFSPISSLLQLETLDLGDSNCTDISFLSNLTKLTFLDLGWNEIENAYIISKLTNMEELYLNNCGLTNLLFLNGLNKLVSVNVEGNGIYDFSILTNVSGTLNTLIIGNYTRGGYELTIDDLQFLEEMDNLICLSMIYSGITQIPDLSGLTKLTSVSLHGNSLYMKDVVSNLPVAITSRESWISETGMDTQNVTEEVLVGNEEQELPIIEDIRADFSIGMKGLFEGEIYVVAKRITDIREYVDYIHKLYAIVENVLDVELYDIKVYDKLTHERVQPIGAAQVSIALDENKAVDKYYVFRLGDDGEWIEVDSFVRDGRIYFYSDHFSVFSIVMTELVNNADNADKDNTDEENNNSTTDGENRKSNRSDIRFEIAIVAGIVLAVFTYTGIRRYVINRG